MLVNVENEKRGAYRISPLAPPSSHRDGSPNVLHHQTPDDDCNDRNRQNQPWQNE